MWDVFSVTEKKEEKIENIFYLFSFGENMSIYH